MKRSKPRSRSARPRANANPPLDIVAIAADAGMPADYLKILSESVDRVDQFRRRYPRLFELMFRELTPRGRRFERTLQHQYDLAKIRQRNGGGSYA